MADASTAVQVKRPAEEEVVVDEAVTYAFSTDYGFERYLKRRKEPLEEVNKLLGSFAPVAANAAKVPADGEKLFLHKSVSRFKPPLALMLKWEKKMHEAPGCTLASGCRISFIQPNTKRPGRTFINPHKPPGKYNYNDGLTYAAIVLLAAGKTPRNEHDEASHLCGHSRCFNAEHLVWEPLGVNASRNECHHYGVACSHNPPCVVGNVRDRLYVREMLLAEVLRKKNMKEARRLTRY
jgi:Zinc-binding loop region of homing endonuclease